MKKYKHLFQSLCCIALVVILQIPILAKSANETTTISEAYIPSEFSINHDFSDLLNEKDLIPIRREIDDTTNRTELKELIQEYQELINSAHDLAEAMRALGYNEDHPIIEFAKKEYEIADSYLNIYQNRLDNINNQWADKFSEYSVATEIWLYMKEQGWNDAVCAGVIGNMMTEAGGNTLNIQYITSNKYYYGICQWNKRYSAVWGSNLEFQCKFLADTIEYEFNTFGYSYKKGFNFNSFLSLNNEKEVAKAFAKCYERCGSESYNQRQINATIAYNYFVN